MGFDVLHSVIVNGVITRVPVATIEIVDGVDLQKAEEILRSGVWVIEPRQTMDATKTGVKLEDGEGSTDDAAGADGDEGDPLAGLDADPAEEPASKKKGR